MENLQPSSESDLMGMTFNQVSDELTDSPETPAAQIAQMVEAKRSIYETFARRGDFGIKIGDRTCYDHGSNSVIIGAKQLVEMGITAEHEVDFSVLHELGHMEELFADPEGYERIIAEGQREDGLGNIYFRLYNCLMDIYVNTNNANRFPVYRSGSQFSPAVSEMYQTKLFSERDFTESPRCTQFSDYLLNLGMNATDGIRLSPEVAEVIQEGLQVRGKHKSFEQFIQEYLVPVIGNKGAEWQATASQRKRMIDNFIRPIFERLLETDKAENKDLSSVGASVPGDIEAGDFRDAVKDAKTKKAEREMTPEEKARAERQKQLDTMSGETGLTPEENQKFQELFERMQSTIYQLVDLWKSLRTATVSWDQKQEGYYKTGSSLSIKKVITDWGDIQRRPDEVPVMERRIYEEKEEWKPRNFRLRVLPDLSGSMEYDIEKVQELVIALSASLSAINAESKLLDPESPKISCALDVIGFSDDAVPIIEDNEEIELIDIMRTYGKIQSIGGTSDHTALERVNNSIDEPTISAIQSGDIIDILVEITDGATSNSALSRKLVDAIAAKGVILSAIKFGEGVRLDKESDNPEEDRKQEMAEADRDSFGEIWNQGQAEPRGYRIRKAEEIAPTLYRILRKLIEAQT